MPDRVLRHIYAHPWRLMATIGFLLVISWAAAITAVVLATNANEAAARAACLQVNELRRELYVAGADIGIPLAIRQRFLPTMDCG